MFQMDLGHTYAVLGYRTKAIEHFQRALELAPTDSNIYIGFGYDLNQLGLPDEAARVWQQAEKLDPQNAKLQEFLGSYFQEQGDLDQAITHFRNAVQTDVTQTMVAANSLAVILITHPDPSKRNGPEAVQLALTVHELLQSRGESNPQVLTTLAEAYTLCGQWEKASETLTEAIRLAQSMGQLEFSQQLQGRLEKYRRMP